MKLYNKAYKKSIAASLARSVKKMARHLKKKKLRKGRNKNKENVFECTSQQEKSNLEINYPKPSNITPQNNLKPTGIYIRVVVLYHFAMTVFYALLVYHTTTIFTRYKHIYDPYGHIPSTGGHFKFLVHTNEWFQLVFFGMQLFIDLARTSSVTKYKLQKICDIFYTTIATPTSFFVAGGFWATYAYDRNLVYPEVFDVFVPRSSNHFFHTTIVLWILLESILCRHRYASARMAVIINFTFNAAYMSWVIWIFVKSGYWVYPILYLLPLNYQVLFCCACTFTSLPLYFFGQAFARIRWGKILYIE